MADADDNSSTLDPSNTLVDEDDDDDDEVLPGPRVEAQVKMAATIRTCTLAYTYFVRVLIILIVRQRIPRTLQEEIQQPEFLDLVADFLDDQLTQSGHPSSTLPSIQGKISVYPSALAMYYAPSDISGIGGMRRERIRAVTSWRKGPPRYDCIFVSTNTAVEGMRGLDVARVQLFFSFKAAGNDYPCALVHWYSRVSDEPDEATGMWIVEPDIHTDGSPVLAVIHLDTIVRAAHLIGTYGEGFIPKTIHCDNSLDSFYSYYVNKFVDHHAFDFAH